MSNLKINGQLISDTDYSTSEVKTGATWTDGKPIYRKCFSGTQSTYSDSGNKRRFILCTISDVSSLVNVSGTVMGNATGWNTGAYFFPSTITNDAINAINMQAQISVNSANTFAATNVYHTGTNNTACIYTVIVEYTKTTD